MLDPHYKGQSEILDFDAKMQEKFNLCLVTPMTKALKNRGYPQGAARNPAHPDPELAKAIAGWPKLSADAKARIPAIVEGQRLLQWRG